MNVNVQYEFIVVTNRTSESLLEKIKTGESKTRKLGILASSIKADKLKIGDLNKLQLFDFRRQNNSSLEAYVNYLASEDSDKVTYSPLIVHISFEQEHAPGMIQGMANLLRFLSVLFNWLY